MEGVFCSISCYQTQARDIPIISYAMEGVHGIPREVNDNGGSATG